MRYYILTASGGDRFRWQLNPQWEYDFDWQFNRCSRISDWSASSAVLSCPKTKVYEDMPWTIGGTLVVSDRLRALIEKRDASLAQFLPVTMEGPGAADLPWNYWILNLLKSCDCLDKPRSMNEYDDGSGAFVEQEVVEPAKIPDGFVIGRIVDDMTVAIICEDLCQEINDAGLIGPNFLGLWHSTDPDAPEPIWKPGVPRE